MASPPRSHHRSRDGAILPHATGKTYGDSSLAIVHDPRQRELPPLLPLLAAADPARVVAWREGEAIGVARFLDGAAFSGR